MGTPGFPKPASLKSRDSTSMAIRRFCCVSTICSLARNDLLVVVRIVNAAATTTTDTAIPTMSSIRVNPACAIDRRIVKSFLLFWCNHPVDGQCSISLHRGITFERTFPCNGYRHIALGQDNRFDDVGYGNSAPDLLKLGPVYEAVPQQTISSSLRLRRGANGVTVGGTLSINSVITNGAPSVELNTFHHVGREGRHACEFVRINVFDERDTLHRRHRQQTRAQEHCCQHPFQQRKPLFAVESVQLHDVSQSFITDKQCHSGC